MIANQIYLQALFVFLPVIKPSCCKSKSFKLPIKTVSIPNQQYTCIQTLYEKLQNRNKCAGVSTAELQNLHVLVPFCNPIPLLCRFATVGILSIIVLQQNALTFKGVLVSYNILKASSDSEGTTSVIFRYASLTE